jgi:hypothetical protein
MNDGSLKNLDTLLLHVSNTNDYHNGSLDGQVAAGRQRWGDYAQVTVDPSNANSFWVVGEFAREPNDAANGHPGGTGGTRWGTWISQININPTVPVLGTSGLPAAVPEPGAWAMMLLGFGLVGGAVRRRVRAGAMAA